MNGEETSSNTIDDATITIVLFYGIVLEPPIS
jgi:hypothetical protein